MASGLKAGSRDWILARMSQQQKQTEDLKLGFRSMLGYTARKTGPSQGNQLKKAGDGNIAYIACNAPVNVLY
jgi:hypothetical protein